MGTGVLRESCFGMRTLLSTYLNFLMFPSPVASEPRDQSPAVVVTVVTISALLVLGSVMSVLAIWRR